MIDKYLHEVPWETKALQRKSFHIDCSKVTDEFLLQQEIKENIKENGRIFIQAFISHDNSEIIPSLSKLGFYYVETRVTPYLLLDRSEVVKSFLPGKDVDFFITDKFDYKTNNTIKKIAKESFTKDRFHFDPLCCNEMVDLRFVNWVDDMLDDPKALIYAITNKNKIAGFLITSESRIILTAIDKNSRGEGLGKTLWLSTLKDMLNKGIKEVETVISTNNIEVLNLCSSLGFKFKNPSFVFHFWENSGK